MLNTNNTQGAKITCLKKPISKPTQTKVRTFKRSGDHTADSRQQTTQHTADKTQNTIDSLKQAINTNPFDVKSLYKLCAIIALTRINKYINAGGATEKTYSETDTSVNALYKFKTQILEFMQMQNIDVSDISSLFYTKTGKPKTKLDSDARNSFNRLSANTIDSDGANIIHTCIETFYSLFNAHKTNFNLEMQIDIFKLTKFVYPFGESPKDSDYTIKHSTPIQQLYKSVDSVLRGNNKQVYTPKKTRSYITKLDKYGNTYYQYLDTIADSEKDMHTIQHILTKLSDQQQYYTRLLMNGLEEADIVKLTGKKKQNVHTQCERLRGTIASELNVKLTKFNKVKQIALYVNGEYNSTYKSINQCAQSLHIAHSQIVKCLSPDYKKDCLSFGNDRKVLTFKLVNTADSTADSATTTQQTTTTTTQQTTTQQTTTTQHTQRPKTYIDYMFSTYRNRHTADSEQVTIAYINNWIDNKPAYNSFMWLYSYKTPFAQRTAQTKIYI